MKLTNTEIINIANKINSLIQFQKQSMFCFDCPAKGRILRTVWVAPNPQSGVFCSGVTFSPYVSLHRNYSKAFNY